MNKEKSITEQEVSCECGWHGTVIECGCDADMPFLEQAEDDGRLRCPSCWEVVSEVKE